MNSQVYADNVLIYDTNLEDYALQGLEVTASILAGGTAKLILPAGHPAYNSFVEYKTIIRAYRDGELVFRGRPVMIENDFYQSRTVTCEGERCILHDAVLEPYLYQASPAVVFSDIITRYNQQVDPEKRFVIGSITAKDPNDYVRMESETAVRVDEVIDKLIERVGGYLIFTTDDNGDRVINWFGSVLGNNSQVLDFGENLLDMTRTTTNADLATIVWPYGAKDEQTGDRVGIAPVNNAVPYLEDLDAIAVRGRIAVPVYWDDVQLASNLLAKARQYLEQCKQIYTTIDVSAVDLAGLGVDVNTLRVGYNTRVRSLPHELDAWYPMFERDYDLLDGVNDRIKLGWDTSTMTGGDVAGDKETREQLRRTEQSIKTDYRISITDAVARIRR